MPLFLGGIVKQEAESNMKRIRKLLGALLLILSVVTMQLPAFGAEAASTTQTVTEFVANNDGVLTKYNGTSSSVIIPSNVITIGTDAFKGNTKITSVVIPNTVKSIEPYAFWNCSSLSMVSIGTGLSEIGDFAFANCKSLSSANIPSNIKRIGIYAFEDDYNLTDITIPIETMDIHETAFDGCYKLVIHAIEGSYPWKYAEKFYERQKEFPEYEDVANYNPDGNTDGNGSGSGDGNGSGDSNGGNGDGNGGSEGISNGKPATNPDGTGTGESTIITNETGTELASVHIVGNKAVMFMNGSSPTVYFGNQGGGAVDNSDGSTDGTGSGTGMDENADMSTSGLLPKYTIVDDTVIADQAYYLDGKLGYVTLPSTIKEIGQFSYARSSLNSIVLPEGLETIGYGAFYHCDNLGYVTIPESIKKIEPKAFDYSAYYAAFMSGADGADYLISGPALLAYKGSDEEVVIPDGVKIIAAQAFKDNTSIKSVTFPESLVSIGEEAFCGCKNLSTVNLEATALESVLDRAFYDTAVLSATLPESFSEIGINAFDSDCILNYQGSASPTVTHENTAERLSNEDFRLNAYKTDLSVVSESSGKVGVNVNGVEGAVGSLEGAKSPYYLNIKEIGETDGGSLQIAIAIDRAKAFLSDRQFTGGAYFDIELTDKSGISITKLGHTALTVAIPRPEKLSKDKALTVLTIDRNGQLEELSPDIVESGDKTYVRFDTYHLSPFAIFEKADSLSDGDILTAENVLEAHAAPPTEELSAKESFKNWLYLKRFRIAPAAALLVGGFVLILYKKKRFN